MILIVQDDKKRNDVIEDDEYGKKMLSKITNKRLNYHDERYIKTRWITQKRLWKNWEEEEVLDLKDCYKIVKANMEF